jgi:hypothetical protein
MPGSGYPPSSGSVSRLVIKQNTVGQSVLTGTSVSTAASGTGYGSWVQVTASTAAEYYITGVSITPAGSGTTSANTDGPFLVDIGRGAAASEVVQATVPVGVLATNGSAFYWSGTADIIAPLRVASGQRLAARVARMSAGTTSAVSFYVALTVVPYLNVEGN